MPKQLIYRVNPAISSRIYTPGEGRGTLKGVGTLVVSHGGVNFGFWSHLGQGVLGKTPPYLAVKVSFRVAGEKL